MNHRFPKHQRLLKRWQFVDVQQNGHKVVSRFFIGIFQMRLDQDHSRLGITVTRRFGNAVVRNRLKRMVREAYRTGGLSLPPGVDLVVIPKKHTVEHLFLPSRRRVFADLSLLGNKLFQAVGG